MRHSLRRFGERAREHRAVARVAMTMGTVLKSNDALDFAFSPIATGLP
jgi:hypothetical protein